VATPPRHIETGDGVDLSDLPDLPPLDGDAEEQREQPSRVLPEGDLDVGDDTSSGDLDDSTGENDKPHPDDLEIDAGDGQWLEEPADAKDLDIGAVEIDDPDGVTSTLDGDDGAPAADDEGIGEGLEAGGLDSGEEGPLAADEDLREQDLPDLGQAEDDEANEDLTGADLPSVDAPLGLAWAARPWTRVGAPVPIASALAVTCAARGAIVAGALESRQTRDDGRRVELLRVDLEGACQTASHEGLTGEVRGLSADGDLLVVRSESRELFASREGGAFERIPGRAEVEDFVVASGVVWARSDAGRLMSFVPGQGSFLEHTTRSAVVSLCDSGAGDVAALVAGGGGAIELVHGRSDCSIGTEVITLDEKTATFGAPLGGVMAARGTRVAYATRGGVVSGSPSGDWRWQPLVGSIVALCFTDGSSGLVAAVYVDAEDTTGLVSLDGEGPPQVMALLGPTQADIESDGRALSFACDETRGVVWVVGKFGLAAFSIR
jgi:hypothetical protein